MFCSRYVNNLQFENYWPQHKFTSPDCRPNCKWNKTAILDLTGKPAPRQPWIYKDRRLQWNQFVYRGPVCNAKSWDRSEEDQYGGGDTFWNDDSNKSKPKNKGADAYAKKKGFNGTFFQYCCEEKKRCLKEGMNQGRMEILISGNANMSRFFSDTYQLNNLPIIFKIIF